jgi:PIN domain nuclease of toxin-antitoxin system
VKLLLDTHLLLWVAGDSKKLSKAARTLIDDPQNELLFSALSIWEIALKSGLKPTEVVADARVIRRSLLDNGYTELPITSEHTVNVDRIPMIHKDPFDRILLAQAMVEGITLLTGDRRLAEYPGPIRKV